MVEEIIRVLTHPMFLWGAVGAFIPELIMLRKMRLAEFKAKSRAYYVVITLLYVGTGGLLAVGLQAANTVAAVYLGASGPPNLGLYFGTGINPGEIGEEISFRQMLSVVFYRRPRNSS